MTGDGLWPPGHASRRLGGGRAGGAGLSAALARSGRVRGVECDEARVMELTTVAVVAWPRWSAWSLLVGHGGVRGRSSGSGEGSDKCARE
jgi:hypothetical protein